jgi:hypothetical protein
MVDWEVHVYTGKETEEVQVVGVHTCNETDYKDFYTPSKYNKDGFENLTKSDVLLCMNDTDDKGNAVNQRLYSPDENTNHRRVELIFKPCVPKVMTSDKNDTDYNSECLVRNSTRLAYSEKLNEVVDYLGTPELIFVYNHEKLDLKKFWSESIFHDVNIMNYQWDAQHPVFLLNHIHRD